LFPTNTLQNQREARHRALINAIKPNADKYHQELSAKQADHSNRFARGKRLPWLRRAMVDDPRPLITCKPYCTRAYVSSTSTGVRDHTPVAKKYADAEPLLLEALPGLKKNSVDAKGQLAQTALQRLVERALGAAGLGRRIAQSFEGYKKR
jgi:hypothetical protein